ncbi:MAG: helix-turn-helix domain-containing protein [Rhodomicrobium sp.]
MSQNVARTHRMLAPPQSGGLTIAAIAYEGGFASLSHFNRCFRQRYGSTLSGERG